MYVILESCILWVKRMDIFTYNKKCKKTFEEIADKGYFYSNGVLYKKVFRQDLKEYGITNVNAISIINGGLTLFENDEEVIEATMKYDRKRE